MKECNIVKQSPIAGLAAYGGGAGSVIFGRKGVDGYQIDRSLRFNSADSAYLNRTPSSAGSNTTWTLSTWVKKTGNDNHIFGAGAGNNPGRFGFGFNGSDKIFAFVIASNSTVFSITTDAVFRDPSAWYHIVLIADTTNSTQADRFKIYVNGVLQTVTGTLMPSSQNTYVNTTAAHTFGRRSYTSSDYFNGYLADVNFIDGQAHAVTDFGAFDADTGVWNPKRFSGARGTNGFHLKFADYSSNAALGTDSSSNSNNWTVNNLTAVTTTANTAQTWSSNQNNYFSSNAANAFDGNLTTSAFATSGANANAYVDITAINASKVEVYISAYGSGSAGAYYYCRQTNNTQHTYTITSYGTSLGWVTVYEGSQISINRLGGARNSSAAAGSAQYAWRVDGVLLVNAGTAGFDPSGIDSLLDTPTNYEADSGNNGGNYATLSGVDNAGVTLSNGNLEVATSGWQSFKATIGVSSGKYYWESQNKQTAAAILGVATAQASVLPNGSIFGSTGHGGGDSNPAWTWAGANYYFNATSAGTGLSNHSATDIVMYALDLDNGKLWFGRNGTWYNSSWGTTGNPATGANATVSGLNTSYTYIPAGSIVSGGAIYNFGQRSFVHTPPTGFKSLCTTNLPDPTIADGSTAFDALLYTGDGQSSKAVTGYGFSPGFLWLKERSSTSDHGLWNTVVGSGKYLSSNLTSAEFTTTTELNSIDTAGFTVGSSSMTNQSGQTYVAWAWDAGSSISTVINVGDKNSSAYNTSDTWSGDLSSPNGAYNNSPVTNAFNGSLTSGFEAGNPSSGYSTIRFQPATAITVNTQIRIYVFDYNDGSVTYQYRVNDGSWNNMPGESSSPYRAWRDLGFTGSLSSFEYRSNTSITYKPTLFAVEIDGALLIDSGTDLSGFTQYPSISSTVRANQSAGFSVVSWSGTSANATVGHGLNAAPEFIITKVRGMTSNWYCYHTGLTDATKYIWLNSTNGEGTQTAAWNSTDPTSSVIHVGGEAEVNRNGYNTIAYCFAPVAGFSAFGSYGTNGSADGPFVYTGFRPRWALLKESSASGELWVVYDSERNTFNVMGKQLYPSLSAAEADASADSHARIDFLSNGFKIRGSHSSINTSGETVIYAAFAEHPFKTARAR